MVLSLTGCKEKPVEQKEDIYIIYTNDVHCAVQGDLDYASVVALKNELLEEHKYVTIVDSGDYIQGGSIGTLTKGSSIIEIMNKTRKHSSDSSDALFLQTINMFIYFLLL